MFLTSGCLMILTVIYFVIGVFAERAVCQPLNHPSDSRIFNVLDDVVTHDLRISNPDFPPLKVSSVVRCVPINREC